MPISAAISDAVEILLTMMEILVRLLDPYQRPLSFSRL
jgi:hypothetical protein